MLLTPLLTRALGAGSLLALVACAFLAPERDPCTTDADCGRFFCHPNDFCVPGCSEDTNCQAQSVGVVGNCVSDEECVEAGTGDICAFGERQLRLCVPERLPADPPCEEQGPGLVDVIAITQFDEQRHFCASSELQCTDNLCPD
ncbi:MAG: hypothetical protein Q8O67_22720 [Deltaproteobacteria bacterium]|nr:hypothetical protein [Deltaproteobacteria bacterium]